MIHHHLKTEGRSLTVNFDASLEGIAIKIPHFELVYLLDTLYRLLLDHTSSEGDHSFELEIKKEEIRGGLLSLSLSTNGASWLFDFNSNSDIEHLLQSLNLKAITQQINSYAGAIEFEPPSPASTTKATIRIYLPLLQSEEDKGVNQ
jgi:hypothetical protein